MSPFDRFLSVASRPFVCTPTRRSFPEALVIPIAPNRPWIRVNCPRVCRARRDLPIVAALALRCEKRNQPDCPRWS